MIDEPASYRQLAELVATADQAQRRDAAVRAEVRRWTRPPGSGGRDGVPGYAFLSRTRPAAGQLAQRDFDLGRGLGLLDGGGGPPPATAVLVTVADDPAAWMQACEALHRILLRAASRWVFASLHTQPLELPGIRDEDPHPARAARYPADAVSVRPIAYGRGNCPPPAADLLD